jgi:oxalate decarboxylase/phosphoglucose isomerase-like protein (cupin superfamily)
MKHYNINKNSEPGLEQFSDDRGYITDIFYKLNINHGCIITNSPGAVRGNHYHKLTTQYTYVLEGSLDYYSKPADSDQSVEKHSAVAGDFIISEPMEIHAMKSGENGCTFIAFAAGTRGGEDYETDTHRVESIVPGDAK